MKKIGFIDFYISEWHANNYPVWIKEICEANALDFKVCYAYAEKYVSPVDGRNTDEWCENFGVERCNTIEELCEKSDYIIILSPSNPEKHLEYASVALKYGKNTYIDKTFAPSFSEAKEIFEIAKNSKTNFFSSSALRYATELNELRDIKKIDIFGGGSNAPEYIIHVIEILVSLAGDEPKKVMVEKSENGFKAYVEFMRGLSATLNYDPDNGYAVVSESFDGKTISSDIKSKFFLGMLSDILRFFESGVTSFDTRETLSAMKIRDSFLLGTERLGEWIEI